MNEEIIKVAPEVVKTTLPQLANSVYQDLLSPAMKKAGQALGNVIDFATLSFIPLEYVSARIRMNIDKNLKNYQKKLPLKIILLYMTNYVGNIWEYTVNVLIL